MSVSSSLCHPGPGKKKDRPIQVLEQLRAGLAHFHANRFQEARGCCETILGNEPQHVRALELAGLASLSLRQTAVGLAFLQRAVAAPGATAETWLHLAKAHLSERRWTDAAATAAQACAMKPELIDAWSVVGMATEQNQQWDKAEEAYERVLALRPTFAEAHCNLGGIRLKQSAFVAAAAAFEQALSLKPHFPEAWNGLGIARKNRDEFELAAQAFEQAIEQRPAYPEAIYNLGNTRRAQGRSAEAIAAYRRVLSLTPNAIETVHNLGCALCDTQHFVEAAECFRAVLTKEPKHADAANHLGNALLGLDRVDEAILAYQQAMANRPGFADAVCNLGNALLAQNRATDALGCYREAMILKPDSAAAAYNSGLAQLLAGSWDEGFRHYERRWETEQKAFRPIRREPLWLGQESLKGKTILLIAEQGLGDTLQFIRYIPLLQAAGANVMLQVQASVKALLAAQPMLRTRVYSKSESTPDGDFYCPLGSLPHACKTGIESVPAPFPLQADPVSLADWKAKLSSWPSARRVGVICSGNARHKNDFRRSIPLSAFAPLADVLGVPLHLIQKDLREEDRAALDHRFVDWSSELDDFHATAALVATLDLVITVDTSVAHLAGTLGKPTWTLLPYAPDWRWLLQRPDTPWYPSMRLFRQPSVADWSTVFQDVKDGLEKDFPV